MERTSSGLSYGTWCIDENVGGLLEFFGIMLGLPHFDLNKHFQPRI